MRTWEGSLAGHYQLEETTIATCFRITLRRHPQLVADASAAITQSDTSPQVTTKYEGVLQTGDVFRFANVSGMSEVNGKYFVLGTALSSSVFQLNQYNASGVVVRASTSAYTAHTGGGEIQRTYGLTNVDIDVVSSGVVYHADVGFLPASIRHLTDMNVTNSETQGVYSSAIRINKDDIIFGRFDNAEYEIFEVNHENPSQGKLITGFGSLGDMVLSRNMYTAEFKSVSDPLKQENMRVVTADCPYVVGDAKCMADIASTLASGTVASTTSRKIFVDGSRGESNQWFRDGIFTFTTGGNSGISYHVKRFAGGEFEFYDAVLYAVTSGTGYEVTAGCDKSSNGTHGCITKWNNIVNFGGFDFVVGTKAVTEHGSYGA